MKTINGKDPFDYVQNWGRKYHSYKNPHTYFSIIKNVIHAFYLDEFPLDKEELQMEFKFENGDIMNLDYYFYILNIDEENKLLGSNILSQKEFDEFFSNETRKHEIKPNIFEMMKKYKNVAVFDWGGGTLDITYLYLY